MVMGPLEVFEKFSVVVAQEEVWCGTGGSIVGGVVTIQSAKVKSSLSFS